MALNFTLNWVSTGSGNGLSPLCHQVITGTNAYFKLDHERQWKFNQNTIFFTKENAYENVIAILFNVLMSDLMKESSLWLTSREIVPQVSEYRSSEKLASK